MHLLNFILTTNILEFNGEKYQVLGMFFRKKYTKLHPTYISKRNCLLSKFLG